MLSPLSQQCDRAVVPFLLALMIGCASTQLDVNRNHPASPKATSTPLPPVGRALDANFEPENGKAAKDQAPANHSHHGGHSGPPDQASSQDEQPPPDRGRAEGPASPAGGAHAGHGSDTPPAAREDEEPKKPQATPEQQGQHSGSKPEASPQAWTCSMHPEIVRAEPGKCPICGMKLKPRAPKAPK